jgi:predicted permease
LKDWLDDLRYGTRMLLRQKGFTATATLSLALGIGLNTTAFSLVNAVLLKGTLVRDPDRLVEIYSGISKEYPHLTTSYADYKDIRDGANAFSGVAAHALVRGIMTAGGRSELVVGEVATANYLDVLGVAPALGRGFLPEEDATEGSHPVLLLSNGMWQSRFAGSRDVLGKTLKLSGVEYTVVGVAPAGFTGTIPGFQPEFWAPTMMVDKLSFSGIQSNTDDQPGGTRLERRGWRWLFVKGRLAEGRTIEEARAQVETIYARLRQEYPVSNKDVKPALMPGGSVRFHPMLDPYVRAASAGLLVAVTLVLIIACANVASMLLARAAARRREFAVRAAVGASRVRLVRQLLVESLLLAAVGGTLGLAVAFGAGRVLSGLGGESLPIPLHFALGIDGRVLLYAVGASVLTALLFGLTPALSASRPDLVAALKADATGEGSDRPRLRLRHALVATQLATSLVLLIAGALLARGLLVARGTDLGFDPKPIATLAFNLKMNGYDQARAMAFTERALETLRALPGVEAATTASRLPLAPDINMEGVRVPGQQGPHDDPVSIDAVEIGPDYFEVAGIPIVAGRAFTASDREGSPRVVIVNQTMARRFWPHSSPIGQRLYMSEYDQPPYEVVGVCRDHKVRSVGEPPRPYLHTSWLQTKHQAIGLAVRVAGPAEAALPMLKKAVLGLDPEIVFTDEGTAQQVADLTMSPTRIGATILGAFGALALVLAALGLYGVVSYSVARRTREVGVRMAIGARPLDVVRLVLAEGLRLAVIGIAIGAALSAVAARVLKSMLYGVSAMDPIAYLGAGLVLLLVAVVANLAPALRAARIQPIRALRYE